MFIDESVVKFKEFRGFYLDVLEEYWYVFDNFNQI